MCPCFFMYDSLAYLSSPNAAMARSRPMTMTPSRIPSPVLTVMAVPASSALRVSRNAPANPIAAPMRVPNTRVLVLVLFMNPILHFAFNTARDGSVRRKYYFFPKKRSMPAPTELMKITGLATESAPRLTVALIL